TSAVIGSAGGRSSVAPAGGAASLSPCIRRPAACLTAVFAGSATPASGAQRDAAQDDLIPRRTPRNSPGPVTPPRLSAAAPCGEQTRKEPGARGTAPGRAIYA